jgi:LPXTG-motif cell wall-anchored protein
MRHLFRSTTSGTTRAVDTLVVAALAALTFTAAGGSAHAEGDDCDDSTTSSVASEVTEVTEVTTEVTEPEVTTEVTELLTAPSSTSSVTVVVAPATVATTLPVVVSSVSVVPSVLDARQSAALPSTGSGDTGIAVIAGSLVVAGAALVGARRRML